MKEEKEEMTERTHAPHVEAGEPSVHHRDLHVHDAHPHGHDLHGHAHDLHAEKYKKPGFFSYTLCRIGAFFVSNLIFRRKFLRNELRGKKGAFVVIANHQASLDFVNLIGATRERLTFVISNSFYRSLPVHDILKRMNVIPKQQFQTGISDLKKMKAVVDADRPLVIYPAGMMTENGLSTPIPAGTWSFLRWLGVDVYMAKTVGTYFAMPKWSGKMRPGRTYLDIYKLFDAKEFADLSQEEVRERAENALLFDAYREQENYRSVFRNGNCVEGLENVLYECPVCHKRYTIRSEGEQKDRLTCTACGFSERADEFGFLHNDADPEREIRYVSDWAQSIHDRLCATVNEDTSLSMDVRVRVIDEKKHRFYDAGSGVVRLTAGKIAFSATVNGEQIEREQPVDRLPTLPFSPGKHFELQFGKEIYRCLPGDPCRVMEFIDLLKACHERSRLTAEAK